MANNVALIIIFNHRFERNIPILREIYSERFTTIRFLVPFYQGDSDDVITVYDNSYQFEGYIAQAYTKLSKLKCQHYVFIGDDLILNPIINETNIIDELHMGEDDVFIESLKPLKETKWHYHRFLNASRAFEGRGINYINEIPDRNIAIQRAFDYGFENCLIKKDMKEIIPDTKGIKGNLELFVKKIIYPVYIDYPLFTGYSDFIVVPNKTLKEFSRLCGIFSSMRLFVEIAIPTAIILTNSNERIKTQKNIKMKTEKMWCASDFVKDFEERCMYKIDNMCEQWPDNYMYLHPVKLSKWT